MNPYLENRSVWGDFHRSYLLALREAIVPSIAPRYIAKIEEHIDVRDGEDDDTLDISDVSVAKPGANGHHSQGYPMGGGGVALMAPPVTVRMPLAAGRRKSPVIEDY